MISLFEYSNQVATVQSEGELINMYIGKPVSVGQLNLITKALDLGWVNILDLSSSSLQLKEVSVVANLILDNAPIRNLNLWGNSICDEGIKIISNALLFNTSLSHIDLGSNSITDLGACFIADVIRLNKTLYSLELGSNLIKDQGAFLLGEALSINTTLSEFHFSDNPITNEGANWILKGLKQSNSKCFRFRDDVEITILSPEINFELQVCNYNNSAKELMLTQNLSLVYHLCARLLLFNDIPFEFKCQILNSVYKLRSGDSKVITKVLLSRILIGNLQMDRKFTGQELIRNCYQIYRDFMHNKTLIWN